MATAVSTTARGGWHVYFRFDPSLQLVQTTITSSLDVRIGGLGYVIAPSPGNGRHWIQPLLIDAAHGGAAMALGAAEKAA